MKTFKQYTEETSLNSIYSKAPKAKKEIDSLGKDIAKEVGGFYIDGGIKSKNRSKEKIENEYDGDSSKLKDVVRGTIAVDKSDIENTKKLLKKHSSEIKHHKGNESPLGYSGVNSHIKTNTGLKGEIQVNTPEMIYAKEKPDVAKKMLGVSLYNKLKDKIGLAGKGHAYYEKWRELETDSPEQKQVEKEGKRYYARIRKQLTKK